MVSACVCTAHQAGLSRILIPLPPSLPGAPGLRPAPGAGTSQAVPTARGCFLSTLGSRRTARALRFPCPSASRKGLAEQTLQTLSEQRRNEQWLSQQLPSNFFAA